MLIYLLFGLLVVLYGILYVKVNKDIFTPALLFLLAYIVSVGCALFNVERWGISMIPMTFFVLLIGAAEFVVIGVAIDRKYKKRYEGTRKKIAVKEIDLPWWKIIAASAFCAVYIALLYFNMIEIASRNGKFNTLSQALNIFKEVTSVTLKESLPWWLGQVERIAMLCAYIFLYIFVNNLVAKGRRMTKEKALKLGACLLPVLLHLCNGFLVSDRLQMLQILVGGIVIYFLIWSYHTGKAYISIKTIGMLAIAACGGLVLFYLSASLVGRINTKGLLEYITFYCGCSIECLNQFFKHPPAASEIFGKETFYNLNLKLYNLGLLNLDKFYPIHLEFRYYGDVMVGNIYTAYRRWIYDFGYIGAMILQGVMAGTMSVFYNKLKYRTFKNTGFWLVLYSYIVYTIVFHPIDGYFYLQGVSQTFVTTLILLALMYWFFVTMKVKFRGGFTVYINEKWKFEKFRFLKSKEKKNNK